MKPFHFSPKAITWLFVALLSLALLAALASAYQRTNTTTRGLAITIMRAMGDIITHRTREFLRFSEVQLQTSAVMVRPVIETPLPDTGAYWLPLFWKQLELNPALSAISITDTQGNLIQAERSPRWSTVVVDTRTGSVQHKRVYREADFSPLAHIDAPGHDDPRARPGYLSAKEGQPGTVYWSALYRFPQSDVWGVTASIPFQDKQGQFAGVLALDISLDKLNSFFSDELLSRYGVAIVVNANEQLISYPMSLEVTESGTAQGGLPTLAQISPAQGWAVQAYRQSLTAGQAVAYFDFDGGEYITVMRDFPSQIAGWKLVVVAPERDLLKGVNSSTAENITLSVFALLLFGFVLFVVFGKPFRLEDAV